MRKKIVLSLLIIALILGCLPSSALGDDAGLPQILNPKLSVSVSVSKTEVSLGEEISLTFYITNDSEHTLYIDDIGYIVARGSFADEENWDSVDFEGQKINPSETITVKSTYKTDLLYFRESNNSLKCFIYPQIYYYYYLENDDDEKPVYGSKFMFDSGSKITLTAKTPYNFNSDISIKYTLSNVSDNHSYEFDITVTNKSDTEIVDWSVSSYTLETHYKEDSERPSSTIEPNSKIEFTLIYDYSEDSNPPFGETSILFYLFAEFAQSDDYAMEVSDPIETIKFPTYADSTTINKVQLEAQLSCDITEAEYGQEIPLTLTLYNPTDLTYENIDFYYLDCNEIKSIAPNETVVVDLIKTYKLSYYDQILYEGLGETYLIEPIMICNDEVYYMDEWCINYDDLAPPEIYVDVPPSSDDFQVYIESLPSKPLYYNLCFTNESDEYIEIDCIGCLNNGYLDMDTNLSVPDSDKLNVSRKLGAGAYTQDEDGNMFIELMVVGYSKETGKMYWIYDTFPVTEAVPTPEPTQTVTPSPTASPVPTPIPTASPIPTPTLNADDLTDPEIVIEPLDGAAGDSQTANIMLSINNETGAEMSNIKIYDQYGNVLFTLEEIATNAEYTQEFELINSQELYLRVEYTQLNILHSAKTNTIVTLVQAEEEMEKEILVLPMVAFAVFVILTAALIILIRKKDKKDIFE